MKKRILALLLALLLPACALAGTEKLPMDFTGGMKPLDTFRPADMTYEDPSIRVERFKVKYGENDKYRTGYFYAFIDLADASQLRTVSANGFDHRGKATVDVLARRVNAVLAVNGDYFSARPDSYVLRQGTVYRDAVGADQDVLLIDEDGDFHIILASEDPAGADKTRWEGKKIVNAFDFGPALIRNGEKVADPACAPDQSTPDEPAQRMALCQLGPLRYLVVCCDNVLGLTLDELCDLILDTAGEETVLAAYNLDGGNSSQMVFLGKKVNNTKYDVNTRQITDIVYFASAYAPD